MTSSAEPERGEAAQFDIVVAAAAVGGVLLCSGEAEETTYHDFINFSSLFCRFQPRTPPGAGARSEKLCWGWWANLGSFIAHDTLDK